MKESCGIPEISRKETSGILSDRFGLLLGCISRIDSYIFKVEGAEKLEMKVLIFKVGKLWWLRRRREVPEYKEVVSSLVRDAPQESKLLRPLLNIKVEFSVEDLETALISQNSTLFEISIGQECYYGIENQSCKKALEKARIEWESAKTVVEELVFKAPLD
ncbi:hypothetical protein Tco_0553160 [Tanacetum coccineum]